MATPIPSDRPHRDRCHDVADGCFDRRRIGSVVLGRWIAGVGSELGIADYSGSGVFDDDELVDVDRSGVIPVFHGNVAELLGRLAARPVGPAIAADRLRFRQPADISLRCRGVVRTSVASAIIGLHGF